MLLKTEDDEYPYHTQDIVLDISEYVIAHPEQIAKKVARKVAHHAIAFGVTVKSTSDN